MPETQDIGEQAVFLKELPKLKMQEMMGYGDLTRELRKAYPDAFTQLKTSRNELVYGSIGVLPDIDQPYMTEGEKTEHTALLLTEYGFYHVGSLPGEANLQDFTEVLIPKLRESFKKDVPDDLIRFEDERAVPHPEYGTKNLTLIRMSPNNSIGTRMFRDECVRFQELAEQRRDSVAFATLPKDTTSIIEQLTTPIK